MRARITLLRSRRLLGDNKGTVAAVVAVAATALAGVIGLGIEVSSWYMSTRKLQAAADAAAIAAAFEHLKGNDAAIANSALNEARRHGFHGASCAYQSAGADCSIFNPPRSGNYTADDTAFEAEISEPLTRGFSRLFSKEEIRIRSRAVAHAEAGGGNACVLGLDPDDAQTVSLDNNAGIRCGVASNSDSSSSLRLNNNAFVENGYTVVGNISRGNNSRVDGKPQTTGADAVADPYADVDLPATLPGCTAQNGAGSNNITRSFTTVNGYARFCGGWDFKNNVTINLDPGVYIIESKLSIQNNVSINSPSGGVAIVIRGNYPISIKNNAVISLQAPTSGAFQGVAVMGDRTGTPSVTQIFDNNAVLKVTGAIYFPNQILMLENNAISSYCTHLIGRRVTLSNNAVIGNSSCAGSGTRPIEVGSQDVKIRLVE